MGADLWAFVKFYIDGYQHPLSFPCLQASELLRHGKIARHRSLSLHVLLQTAMVELSVIPANSFPTADQARLLSDFEKLLLPAPPYPCHSHTAVRNN